MSDFPNPTQKNIRDDKSTHETNIPSVIENYKKSMRNKREKRCETIISTSVTIRKHCLSPIGHFHLCNRVGNKCYKIITFRNEGKGFCCLYFRRKNVNAEPINPSFCVFVIYQPDDIICPQISRFINTASCKPPVCRPTPLDA